MSRVTSKLQVTIPKSIADRYEIQPGQEIDWLEADEAIRVLPASSRQPVSDRASRLELYDRATERQRARQAKLPYRPGKEDRGWSREELYERGGAG